mmetsp:Transcript_5035/g.16083  ORF Transcript_5035/g.16083 Transcript_5035/m.16083 type:complete len:468 (-) Transcript_5035:2370-3773(-)
MEHLHHDTTRSVEEERAAAAVLCRPDRVSPLPHPRRHQRLPLTRSSSLLLLLQPPLRLARLLVGQDPLQRRAALVELLRGQHAGRELLDGVVDDAQPPQLPRGHAARRALALGRQPGLEAGVAEDVLLRADGVGVEDQALADGAHVLLAELLSVTQRKPRLGLKQCYKVHSAEPLGGVDLQQLLHNLAQLSVCSLALLDHGVDELRVEREDAAAASLARLDPGQQLSEYAANCPHVVLGVVPLGAGLLGRGVGERARARGRGVARDDAGEAKVGDLDLEAVLREQHIVRLEVAVQDPLGVDVHQGPRHLREVRVHAGDGDALGAGAAGVGHEVAQRASVHQLHDDAEVLALLVHIAREVAGDVLVRQAEEHLNLALERVDVDAVLLRLLDVDHFHCVHLAVESGLHLIRLAERPLAQQRGFLVIVGVEDEVGLGRAHTGRLQLRRHLCNLLHLDLELSLLHSRCHGC